MEDFRIDLDIEILQRKVLKLTLKVAEYELERLLEIKGKHRQMSVICPRCKVLMNEKDNKFEIKNIYKEQRDLETGK